MAQNINRVTITGNLTAKPEVRETASTSVCELRVAVNGRRKVDNEWVDKPNFVNVIVFGVQAENAAKYLDKGRPVAVDGRLDWSEWTTEDGAKRQSLKVIAENLQYLGSKNGNGNTPAEDSNESSESDPPF